MEQFIHQTINPELFEIQDVPGDNACFYRSIANYIYYATPHSNITKLNLFIDSSFSSCNASTSIVI